MEFEKKAKLFAVTYASKDGKSLYDWIPFPNGDSLGKMVLDHNQKCLDAYRKMRWGDQFIKTMAEGIYLVPSHIAKISEWSISDFSERNYILIDSTMVDHDSDIRKLVKIMPQGKWYYLLFVGKEMESLAKEFDYGSVVPCGVFQNQAQFEALLSGHCHSYGQDMSEVFKARSIDATKGMIRSSDYRNALASVAINVQGFSNFANMNTTQRKDLAFRISKNGYNELTELINDSSISKERAQDLKLKFLNDSENLFLGYDKKNIINIYGGKYFVLMDEANKNIGIFKGHQPRQAALKAANRGHTQIKLRERGTKKVHVFTGERKQVKKPASGPAWMPDRIWKPNVKKIGIEKLKI